MIEQAMQLHRALGTGELRPGKQRKTQLDDGGVQRQQLVAKPQLVAGPIRESLHLPQQRVEELCIELPGAVFVGIGQRAALGRFLHPEVDKLPQTAAQAPADLPQRLGLGELGEEHGDELVPAPEAFGVPFSSMSPHDLFEFEPREEAQQLTEETGGAYHLNILRFVGVA